MSLSKSNINRDTTDKSKINGDSSIKHSRVVPDYDDDDLYGPNFIDHFSLREPSSTVKFRGARVHVYQTPSEQIILEDRPSSEGNNGDEESKDGYNNGKGRHEGRHDITVKRMPSKNFGLLLLRSIYALVSILLAGFLFAFAFQLILFLFINVVVQSKNIQDGDDDPNTVFYYVATFFSIPIFLIGISSMMAFASTFVSEAWSGGHLIRSVIGAPELVKELLYFVFFLIIPAMTLAVEYFMGSNRPWRTTCYAWACGASIVFVLFIVATVWCEVAACFRLTDIHYEHLDDYPPLQKLFMRILDAILIVQSDRYSGTQVEQYFITGDDEVPETERGRGYSFSDAFDPIHVKRSIYTRITQLGCLNFLYETLDPPRRVYGVEEVTDVLPFVTTHSWSLEGAFCSSSRKRRIITAKGSDALTPEQVMTSAVCNVIGSLVMIITVISLLVWVSALSVSRLIALVLVILCCVIFPLIRSNMAIVLMYRDIRQKGETGTKVSQLLGDNSEEDKATMFKVWETLRVTQPKAWVCFTGMILEIILLFIFPVVSLFAMNNWESGIIFIVLGVFTFLRKYFDASAILCGLGSISDIVVQRDLEKEDKERCFRGKRYSGVERTLLKKSRLADIVGYISKNQSATRWMWFFGTLVVAYFFISILVMSSGDGFGDRGDRSPIVLLDDYEYIPEPSLQYPTCEMSKGIKVSEEGARLRLGDYAFLSALAYETPNITGYILPRWFTEQEAIDQDELVEAWRVDAGNKNVPIAFKFFTFSNFPGAGLIAIRGSQTAYDWMVNFQLWSASALAQIVKWMTPYGWIWDPILDTLVRFMSFFQGELLKDISYYSVTRAFANDFSSTYDALHVTGASLGGGLAIITGAQARIPAIAISGLGADLSRKVIIPPVSKNDINMYTFNFIPDRDYVARVGGRPRNHQEAECTAPESNIMGCHSMWRSICEIQYRCGSKGRPFICRCYYNFGYPAPEPIGNVTRSFEEACSEEEQSFLAATGSTLESGWFDDDEYG